MQTPTQMCSTTTLAIHLFHASLGIDFPRHPSREDLLSLVHREMEWVAGLDAKEARDSYWLAESWSKTPFDIGIDRIAAARETFYRAESQCAEANIRLCDGLNRPAVPFDPLKRARALIKSVLGPFSWDHALRHCSFGPGATFSLSRRKASHPNKWASSDVTARCLPLCLAFQQFNNGWSGTAPKFRVVAGNRVTTVPKNAKTDRTIAIEPTWNMFFQRGIGGMIRHRLQKRCSILLPDAQADHREMAQFASVTQNCATIDLKSASDSVSLGLVELLLPEDWLNAILTTRSEQGEWDGETISYEKVSSMGNGFTFELETLLFWALTKSVVRDGTVSVYGDDIICPAERAGEVIRLLEYCGFTTNPRKTFVSGPFRESCGGHYYNGHEITPPYFRALLEDEMTIISAANTLSHRASQRYGWSRDIRFRGMHRWLSSKVPYRGPLGSSGAIHCAFDEATSCESRYSPRWSRSLQQWRYTELQPKSRASQLDTMSAVFASLYGKRVTEEAYVKHHIGWRVGKALAYGWEGPGSWI